MFVNCTLETWSIECCVLLFERTFKQFRRLEHLCAIWPSVCVSANCREILRAVKNHIKLFLYEEVCILLEALFVGTPTLSSYASNCGADARFSFTKKCAFYLKRCCLLVIGKLKKWQISLTFVYTSFTLYASSSRYFHLQSMCFVSCLRS